MIGRSWKHWWFTALFLGSLLALLFACAPAPTPEPKGAQPAQPATGGAAQAPAPAPTTAPAAQVVHAPAGKKDLVIVQGTDVQKFDPQMSTSDPDIKVSFNIFDNLLTRGQDSKLKPALATEWKQLNDTTVQFKIRQGVKFHNGDPLTAKDVKFSIDRTAPYGDPTIYTRTVFPTIARVDLVDDYTVNVVTKQPDPLILDRLAFYGGQIIPMNYVQKVGNDGFNAKPIGTGPLKFVEWVKDDHLTLEANKDWWGGPIAFDKVIFKPMPESAARVAALLKGEADIVTKLPPDDVANVNKSANAMAVGTPYAGLYVIGSNYKLPFPMNNPQFHQAASLAIDRKSIVDDLWHGLGQVPNGMYPSVDWCYDPKLPPLEYNPTKAKQLLQQAGYKGEEVIFQSTQGYLANDKQMAEAIVTMWKDVGINAKLEIIEYSVRAQLQRDKTYKGFYWSDPTSISLDPDSMIWRLTGPGASQDYLRVPEIDKLMSEAQVTLDQAKRKQLYDQANQLYMQYMQWTPIIQPVESYGIQKYVDFTPMSNQDMPIENIKFK